jgi:uncharacterized alkaline shock family protein YloU
MSEQDQRQTESPLESERGSTFIGESVVSRIAGVTAGEVEGVHLGGSAARTAGGVMENITGSSGTSRGVSAEVGRVEAAIDLTIGLDYGKNILETTDEVRRRIRDRVESLTGLQVTELNVVISDIVFPDGEGGRGGPRDAYRSRRTQEFREREPAESGAPYAGASERSRTEEETRAENAPPQEDETAELRMGEDESERDRRRGR